MDADDKLCRLFRKYSLVRASGPCRDCEVSGMSRSGPLIGVWILLLAACAADAQAQISGANSKVITWQSPESAREIFVGILGEVGKPGVHRLDAQSLTLHAVLRRAGGLKGEASGTIRIVRGDRVVQRGFFSPQVDVPLQPNDLVIIESKLQQAAVSRTYESDPNVRAALGVDTPRKSSEDPGVWLAFLNVLDRPVIVKVKHEEASAIQLVQKLDQPMELAQAVRVISPDRLQSQATSQPVQAPITDGSVLVFPPRAINRSRLPALPPAIESGIAIGAFPSLIGGRAGQSPELRNVGQLPPLMARQPQESNTATSPTTMMEQATIPTPPPSITPLPPPASGRQIETFAPPMQMPVASSLPRIANVPFSGVPRVSSSSSVKSISTEPGIPGGPAVEQGPRIIEIPNSPSTLSNSAALGTSAPSTGAPSSGGTNARPLNSLPDISSDLDSFDDLESPNSDNRGSFVTVTGFLIMIGCVAALAGLAIVTRRFMDGGNVEEAIVQDMPLEVDMRADAIDESKLADSPVSILENSIEIPAAPVVEPTDAEAAPVRPPLPMTPHTLASRLDQLIRNELRICEERVEFPSQMVLQGRIVPPPVYRVDQAANRAMGQGPHIELVATPEKSAVPEKTAAPTVSAPQINLIADQLDGSHSVGPAMPHFMRRAPGQNTIAAAAAAAAASVPSVPRRSTSTPSDQKSSSTPVTDALRQLQGGQS